MMTVHPAVKQRKNITSKVLSNENLGCDENGMEICHSPKGVGMLSDNEIKKN
jgi:hypothetical protein